MPDRRPRFAVLLLAVVGATLTGCPPMDEGHGRECEARDLFGRQPVPEPAKGDVVVLSGVTAADRDTAAAGDRKRGMAKVLNAALAARTSLRIAAVGASPSTSDLVATEDLGLTGVNPGACTILAARVRARIEASFDGLLSRSVDGPTDTLAALAALASHLDPAVATRGIDVIVMSNMVNSTPDLRLDDPVTLARVGANPEATLAALAASDRLAPCAGWRVYIVGPGRTPTGGLDAPSIANLHRFYDRLFERCGGQLWKFEQQALTSYPVPEPGPKPPRPPAPCATFVVSSGVYFDVGQAELRPGAEESLGSLHQFLRDNVDGKPGRLVQIAGYTDRDGDAMSNLRLSEQRAQTLMDVVLARGIEGQNVEAIGYGEPAMAEATEAEKARNRRVEVTVLCATA